MNQRLNALGILADQLTAVLNNDNSLPDGPDAEIAANTLDTLSHEFSVSDNTYLGDLFLVQSDGAAQTAGTIYQTLSYEAAPRIVVVSDNLPPDAESGAATLDLQLDLLDDTSQSLAAPGQVAAAAQLLNYTKGLTDSIIETDVIQTVASGDDTVESSIDILNQALAVAGSVLLPVTTKDLDQLSALGLSLDANALITQEVQDGEIVLVPTKTVQINGVARTAWLELDPTTGFVIAVSDNGSHDVTEYGGLTDIVNDEDLTLVDKINEASKLADRQLVQFFKALRAGNREEAKALLDSFLKEAEALQSFAPQLVALYAQNLEFTLTNYTNSAAVFGSIDPPVGDFLYSPAPPPANHVQTAVVTSANLVGGRVSGNAAVTGLSVAGQLQFQWQRLGRQHRLYGKCADRLQYHGERGGRPGGERYDRIGRNGNGISGDHG